MDKDRFPLNALIRASRPPSEAREAVWWWAGAMQISLSALARSSAVPAHRLYQGTLRNDEINRLVAQLNILRLERYADEIKLAEADVRNSVGVPGLENILDHALILTRPIPMVATSPDAAPSSAPASAREKATCLRCGYKWVPRSVDAPARCARCLSTKWQEPVSDRSSHRFAAVTAEGGEQ